MTRKKRSLGMHPNLLYDIIMRQAGTLQKAILEGVMNAIDAGATECRVNLGTHDFSIEDNGRGFQSEQEIEDWFDTFGTPHEEGDATYGRFRMGRGQLFAFGKNHWITRQFEMEVDVKKSGFDYELIEHKQIFQGTRISVKLYDPITPSDLERAKAELRKFVAWAQIPVILNGDQVSKLPEDGKWTFEDEDAYYALSADRSQLAVYNLGVLISDFWAGRFGVGGTIVTKKPVEVNFARNDIQAICPVFKRIQTKIKSDSGKAAKKKTKLTDAERDMLVKDFLAGEIDINDAADLRALTDVNGRSWPISKLAKISRQFGGHLIVAPRGDQMVETAQDRGISFSIDEATLERFGANDGQAFLARIKESCERLAQGNSIHRWENKAGAIFDLANLSDDAITIVDRDFLAAFVDSNHIELTDKELTADQKLILRAIQSAAKTLHHVLHQVEYEDRTFEHREIHLGRSDTAHAWTDGTKNIWFNVDHARLLRRGYSGAFQVSMTLLHEMLHTGPDTATHEHDHHFYQSFHDISGDKHDPVGQTAERMVTQFLTYLRQNKKKVTHKLLALDDVDLQLAQTRKALEEADSD
tara:strand:- start:268 stop:2019 length:1752 start_codon:yes stop_codon:yes gene_type:complete